MISLEVLSTESDVEQKVIYPLLTSNNFLGISARAIKTKSYLAPAKLDKEAGRSKGYYPDYSVWWLGHPIAVIEAKAPDVGAAIGFREASLYARHLNAGYPHDLNPCRFVISSNGSELLAGYWDQEEPTIRLPIQDINVGTAGLELLRRFCGQEAIAEYAKQSVSKQRIERGVRPFNLAGGQAILNAKRPLNSFASELSPILRRYFSSSNRDNIKEIAERAYVSSAEITEYDRVLEALLKDRLSPRRDTIVEQVRTSKNEEPLLTKAIQSYTNSKPAGGQLQIVQGAVGSGKSLFARRYRDLLEPIADRPRNYWSFVDFNNGPPTLKNAETWLCGAFIESLESENEGLSIYDGEVLRGIFSRKIQQRRAVYETLRGISSSDELRERAKDLSAWQSDLQGFAEGIANYLVGIKQCNLIVVMDNVDRLDLQSQLDAFQLALWFMDRTKALIILQMRDETYERYKNKPPLDTFRAGIAFHISPPRFIDVVKRRLELAIEYLASNAPEKQEYVLDNGLRMVVPKGNLGLFLKTLYAELFGHRRNIARILEGLAGRDVRKALEMFVSIVTSGHLSTNTITSQVLGEGAFPIQEFNIIRILMRTDYRFFSENSGFTSNLFHYDLDWSRPDNFILIEILYFLIVNRKKQGEIGLEGYFAVRRVCDEVERLGYDRATALDAVKYLLRRELIIADHFSFVDVGDDDCIKIQASGFIHLRILCERIEYLYSVLTVTPIADPATTQKIAAFINRESQRGYASSHQAVEAIKVFLQFLKFELARLREGNPFFDARTSGAVYVTERIEAALNRFLKLDGIMPEDQSELDLL